MNPHFPLDYVHDFFGGPGSDLPFRIVVVFGATAAPRVVFYDRRFTHGFPENGGHGQQISAYYLETLLEGPARADGLCLDGGVPNWTIRRDVWTQLSGYLQTVARQWQRQTGESIT